MGNFRLIIERGAEMKNLFNRLVYVCAVFLMFMPLISCGGGGGGGGAAGTGTLNLSLTDAASGDYKAVYVTINEVWVKHAEKDWEMLEFNDPEMVLPQTLNLLDYVNGFRAKLGYDELEAGHYTQMRLILEVSTETPETDDSNILGHAHPFFNYVIDSDDNEIFLKVPSGGQSGVKLVGGFDIENAESTDIILDFDANKSVHAHPAGKTGEWRLRPTIKVVEIINSVSGNVEDVGEKAVPGARVSAQIYDTNELVGSKDEVVSVAGVISDDDGNYFMLLPKNMSDSPYNIVAIKYDVVTENGEDRTIVLGPECQPLESTESKEYTGVNFTLAQAEETGSVSGSIVGLPEPGEGDIYSVYLSIRQYADCDNDGNGEPETMIEVVFKSFVNAIGGDIEYGPITLPKGTYELVAWADGAETIYPPYDIEIEDGVDTLQEIDFTPPPTP
jgi:hypothetical protein